MGFPLQTIHFGVPLFLETPTTWILGLLCLFFFCNLKWYQDISPSYAIPFRRICPLLFPSILSKSKWMKMSFPVEHEILLPAILGGGRPNSYHVQMKNTSSFLLGLLVWKTLHLSHTFCGVFDYRYRNNINQGYLWSTLKGKVSVPVNLKGRVGLENIHFVDRKKLGL